MYLMHVSPSVSHPCLQTFDASLHSAIQCITNTDLSNTQWIQVGLPVRDGGLGPCVFAHTSTPAYLASVASTCALQDDVLSGCMSPDNTYFQTYLSSWSAASGTVPDSLPTKPPFWDHPGILHDSCLVEASLQTLTQRAAFKATQFPPNGDWVFVLPLASCVLCLDE